MLRLLLLLAAVFFQPVYAKDPSLPYPYSEVELLPFNPHGWYNTSHQLRHVLEKYDVKNVIEVGSWLGASTRDIANALPAHGKVYAVDHWLGSAEHLEIAEAASCLPTLYEQFLSNVIHARLTHKIIPVKMDSLGAAEHLKGVKVDLIFLDASHDTESVLKDLEAWYPLIKGHGVLCGDDWAWPSVAKAVEMFADKHHLKIINHDTFWRLKEKK